MRMMFSLMLISFCTLLPCLIPQSQLQCPGSTLGKSHWPIKSNISHSQHIYHFVRQLFIWPGLSYSQTYFFRQRKTIRDLKLVFSPYKCTSVLCWKIHFHSLCLKNLSSGIFFSFKKTPNLNIYISGSLGLEGEISLLPCQASDWPSRIYQSGNEALHVF